MIINVNPYNIARCLFKHRPKEINNTRQFWSLLCIYMADEIKTEDSFFDGFFDKDKFLDICHGIEK